MDGEYIRRLKEMDEFYELEIVQRDVWGYKDIDVVPSHIMRDASSLMGPNGAVLGYFIDEKLIGYVLTFPTSNPREVLLDMLAISPDYQSKGIGYNLMLELRKIMLALKINKIFWTYDPLESVNANLYIRKLGGIITRHLIDYYGSIDSKIHSDLPTDRLIVEWNIRSKHVENRIKNGSEKINQISDNKDAKYVEIPLNIQELKNKDINVAIEWRMKTRKLFDEYIEKWKLIGINFVHDKINQKGIYLFKSQLKLGLEYQKALNKKIIGVKQMPYYSSLKDLPERVRNNLPEHAQHIFMDAFNNAWEQYKEPEKRRGGTKQSREEVAFKVAWVAVENEYKKDETGKWVKKVK